MTGVLPLSARTGLGAVGQGGGLWAVGGERADDLSGGAVVGSWAGGPGRGGSGPRRGGSGGGVGVGWGRPGRRRCAVGWSTVGWSTVALLGSSVAHEGGDRKGRVHFDWVSQSKHRKRVTVLLVVSESVVWDG